MIKLKVVSELLDSRSLKPHCLIKLAAVRHCGCRVKSSLAKMANISCMLLSAPHRPSIIFAGIEWKVSNPRGGREERSKHVEMMNIH